MSEMVDRKEKKGGCVWCGNSPIDHQSTYIFQSISAVISTGDYAMRDISAYKFFISALEEFAQILARVFLTLGALLGIVRFGDVVEKARSYRSQVVWEEARERGIPMQQIIVGTFYMDAYRAFVNGSWRYFISLPFPPHLATTRLWFDDKYLLKTHLRKAGIPVPGSGVALTKRRARALFRELKAPLVVKPRLGSRGRHTTTNVTDEETLMQAFRSARTLCAHVSIEEELEGSVCRGTVIGGVLRGFLEASPTHIVGDGNHSVLELIREKNKARSERMSEIEVTEEVERFLGRNGLSLASVPREGQVVVLTHRTGRLFGGETRELLDTVHPKIKKYLEDAARALDVPVVGFDLIIKNPESDPDAQKWGIIEANTLPFIDLHYLPLKGTPSKTAKAVWDLWDIKDATN